MNFHPLVRVALALLVLFGSACSGLPGISATGTPGPTAAPTATPTQQPTQPAAQESEPGGLVTLRVWLPPEFNPDLDSRASNLLRLRLNEFVSRWPGTRLDVRVKAVDGTGGMLNALAAASSAAPLALPDLIALPRPLMEDAALKGLLQPLNDISSLHEDSDWYDYAMEMSRLQDSTFGLPFAGDALLLVYRPDAASEPPRTWNEALQTQSPLIFPAADPSALFTLAMYQASGGPIQDEQNRPALDAAMLEQVFSFYQQGEASGLLPYWLTQYETDEQAWNAFLAEQSPMVITWASNWLNKKDGPLNSAAVMLTPQGVPYTLNTGWVWAVAGPQPKKNELALELARFLTESHFMAEWSQAAGYLPTRASALAGWTNPVKKNLLGQVALSAHGIPSADLLSSLSPLLKDATIAILKEQGDPQFLAESAAATLSEP